MTEHIDHYINLPLMKLANENLGISSIPGVTPNVISFSHFICACISIKFLISGNLAIRRIGCCIYEFRNQLDLLDGVVYRAQAHQKTYVSGWGSWGYLVDAAMDFGGGLLLAFGIGVFLQRYPPLKRVRIHSRDVESSRKLLAEKVLDERPAFAHVHFDRRAITVKVLLATVQAVARSGIWDYFIKSYHELLEKPSVSISTELQTEVLNYRSTWLVMWLWKFSSADAFFQFTLLAILFDKLWQWIQLVFYVGWVQLAVLLIISQLHLIEVRAYLLGA
ncbi:predicted protein [Nematostella vectensis]|uniref:Ceramide phosphoethanolamine synthase n=2 Tax=Nematostella vectensis TaxID=45351 RepID=A7S4T2_NEMVE|nr:predicted protein [Nematostella vectensis]|eukprot:XP_001633269.1 predicted protein [Nematostella vectensis]